MIEKVLISVSRRIQRGERQPDKLREVPVSQTLPQQTAPLNMIVTVEVAATNARLSRLQPRQHQNDGDRTDGHVQSVTGPSTRRSFLNFSSFLL